MQTTYFVWALKQKLFLKQDFTFQRLSLFLLLTSIICSAPCLIGSQEIKSTAHCDIDVAGPIISQQYTKTSVFSTIHQNVG